MEEIKTTVSEEGGERNYAKRIYILLSFMAALAFIAILKVTKGIAVQIVLSVLLALVALPALRKMHTRLRFPWGLGIVVSLAAFILLIGAIARLLRSEE
ncbi:MAG: hypothetical protein IJS51_08710, partial [Treponema sp.]|nr:hypothetical protein [Treponema sp.]